MGGSGTPSHFIPSSSTPLEGEKAVEEVVFVYLMREETAGGNFCRHGWDIGRQGHSDPVLN